MHLYYGHPYSSWECGTNEVTNKTDKIDEEIEGWINRYPRRIHVYRSAGELFEEEVEKLA